MDGKNEGNHEGHKSFRALRFIYTILQDNFSFFQKREMSLNFTINFPVIKTFTINPILTTGIPSKVKKNLYVTVRILNGLCSQKKNMLYARDKKSYKRAKSMENAIERNIHYASKNDISILLMLVE